MKCSIPEISWHNRGPVLSVDIQPKTLKENNGFYRLATSGIDSHVLIWYMTVNKTGSIDLELAVDLTRHQRAVNVVKWSPNGEYLASGDDENVIFIWKQKGENENLNICDMPIKTDNVNNEQQHQDKEIWISMKILRGHTEDVYDLSWSPNSQFLVSGSVDNTAIIWDVQKGKLLSILRDHKGFVQGVAWDPLNQYIATLSTDRYLRIFDIQTKKVVYRINKCVLPIPEDHEVHGKTLRIYHDDTLQTFFRRLCFSPDGKFIITPSGVCDYDGCVKPLNTTYIYSRFSLKQPSIVLPSPDQYTIAAKCCPILFKLRSHSETNKPVIPLPYRMIFAVATKSSVYLYDTQQPMPFALISNIHYTRLTDLTWSQDGKILIVSSTDGYCSLITFSDNELGEIYDSNKENEANIDNDDDVEMTETSPVKNNETNQNDKSPINTSAAINNLHETKVTETLVLDKNIISSEEKFDTPEKKNLPATPISIRRYPRSNDLGTPPSSKKTLSNFTSILNSATPIHNNDENNCSLKINENKTTPPSTSKIGNEKIKNSSNKKATPIAIRRHKLPNPVEATAIVEEAVDSWPSNKILQKFENVKDEVVKNDDKNDVLKLEIRNTLPKESLDTTEDIRLVYEDSQDSKDKKQKFKEEENIIKSNSCKTSKTPKTPRRVELRTISTPKK